MKKNNFKMQLRKYFLLSIALAFGGVITAQELYVGDGGAFHLTSGLNFTTSNTLVTHHANGVFSIEGGTAWTEATEYVDGKITVIGAGTTVANIGDINQSTMTLTTIAGDAATCDFTAGTPPAGTTTALGNYVLSDSEYWTVTNTGPSADLAVANLTEVAGATYGGAESQGEQPVIVRLDGADWKLYTGNPGTGQFALAVDTRVKVNPIVFLQGAYVNPVGGEETWMRDDLRASGLIPTTSPYVDELVCNASVFTPTGADAIVDWVWVELRDKNDNTNTLGSQSALLQRDGDVVAVDGLSPLGFSSLSSDNYYVVVAHRNHLGVINANTVALSLTSTVLDFSDNNTMQNGGSNTVVDLGNSIFGIYAGDYDGNGNVQVEDVNQASLLIGGSFTDADIDMNAHVQNLDISIINPNIGRAAVSRSAGQPIIIAPLSDFHKAKK